MTRIFLLTLCALSAAAQTPKFDVASIKPNKSDGGMSSIHMTSGRITMENVSLTKVILNAYEIPDDREYMLDGPGWLKTGHFDIEATFPANSTPTAVRRMLQSLLAERFSLALHKETRQLANYSLVVAKNGPKIHPAEPGQPQTSARAGHFEATKITMQKLADLMAKESGRPVTNATGLDGVFTFTLDWSPEAGLKIASSDAASAGISIFTALEEQLGLTLESGKGPVEVLVVDRIERLPTEN
jgi:uncharacterized protein (TIGR03435 family)